ncbi:MAG TPA: molybdate ABC transporter substrate-binding protein [Burkholderiales bacterium]
MKRGLFILLCLFSLGACAEERVLVFAAASLRNALDEVNASFDARCVISYASSSALARQIEAGAPAQVFISADEAWMDYLEKKNLLAAGTRRDLLANRLVWIVPAGRPVPGDPLQVLGARDRLALADPQHVPAGKYARAALERLNVWPAVGRRIAAAENVRAALALVARGEAPLGIVYETDARDEPKVQIAARIDPSLHPRIVYPAAAMRGASPLARRYLDYLAGPRAMDLFARHGFLRP